MSVRNSMRRPLPSLVSKSTTGKVSSPKVHRTKPITVSATEMCSDLPKDGRSRRNRDRRPLNRRCASPCDRKRAIRFRSPMYRLISYLLVEILPASALKVHLKGTGPLESRLPLIIRVPNSILVNGVGSVSIAYESPHLASRAEKPISRGRRFCPGHPCDLRFSR